MVGIIRSRLYSHLPAGSGHASRALPRRQYATHASNFGPHPVAEVDSPESVYDFNPLDSLELGNSDAYVDSYNSMMADCAWMGDVHGALEVMDEMKSLGVTPDATSYYVAIVASRRAGDSQKAVDLLEEMWQKDLNPDADCYSAAICACREASEFERADKLLREMQELGDESVDRFHTTPMMKWNRQLRRCGCSIKNIVNWKGESRLPITETPCWLLPNQDEIAADVAEHQVELRTAGWKVLSCSPNIIRKLSNKGLFIKHAKEQGLTAELPRTYDSAHDAVFPCILKPAVGTFGKDTSIVRSCDDVLKFTRTEDMSPRWVLQELIPGRHEYSTTLLVANGEIYDAVCIRYEYDGEEYVWPNVQEVKNEYLSIPAAHLAVMRRLVGAFSGICCINYKIREDGRMCIFELNPRIGGDLVFDVPKPRARALFEKLDAMFS